MPLPNPGKAEDALIQSFEVGMLGKELFAFQLFDHTGEAGRNGGEVKIGDCELVAHQEVICAQELAQLLDLCQGHGHRSTCV